MLKSDQCIKIEVFFYLIHYTFFYRSIDSNTLIGNIGGYIGICLGYNLLQAPALITTVLRLSKDYFKLQKFFKRGNHVLDSRDTNESNSNGPDAKQNKPKNDRRKNMRQNRIKIGGKIVGVLKLSEIR